MSDKLSDGLQAALVFAARYTHNRATAGAHLVIDSITQEWHRLGERTREQLLKESHEATENIGEWAAFRTSRAGGA